MTSTTSAFGTPIPIRLPTKPSNHTLRRRTFTCTPRCPHCPQFFQSAPTATATTPPPSDSKDAPNPVPEISVNLPDHLERRVSQLLKTSPPKSPTISQFPVITSALDFFRHRQGAWKSYRTTHHLAFRRSESGESHITMQYLSQESDELKQLMKLHELNTEEIYGGCKVVWNATLDWDNEGDNHEGSCVFGLMPDEDWDKSVPWDGKKGRMLRDRGYAEGVPIIGKFWMDDEGGLCLETGYDGGLVEECFRFEGWDYMIRTSVVRRFGGLASTTFAIERRVGGGSFADGWDEKKSEEGTRMWGLVTLDDGREIKIEKGFGHFVLGGKEIRGPAAEEIEGPDGNMYPRYLFDIDDSWLTLGDPVQIDGTTGDGSDDKGGNGGVDGIGRSSTVASRFGLHSVMGQQQQMPVGSAFGSGFSSGFANGNNGSTAKKGPAVDLSKVPPSMRADFERSLELDRELEERRRKDGEGRKKDTE